MPEYRKNREWSDIMIPQIKAIVGPLLLKPASFELDAMQATDLIIMAAKDMRIAARVRRPEYFDKYKHQFTIRCELESGAETEFSKICKGFGDWMFYGHADAANNIHFWSVIDLAAFRAALILNESRKKLRVEQKSNGDGSHFYAFDFESFPSNPPLLVASSHDIRASA